MHVSKPTECTPPRMSSDVKYGLWAITMYPCRPMDCNKRATLAEDAGGGGGCM